MKAKPQNKKITRKPIANLIAVGSRGAMFVRGIAELPKSIKINSWNPVDSVPKVHLGDAEWAAYRNEKPTGLFWVDSGSWLAPRGGKFWIGTFSAAQAAKVAKTHDVLIMRKGKEVKVRGLFPATWKPEHKMPHSVGVDSQPGGRVESRLVSDQRNKHLVTRIALA